MSQSLSEYAAAVLSYALEFDPDFRPADHDATAAVFVRTVEARAQ